MGKVTLGSARGNPGRRRRRSFSFHTLPLYYQTQTPPFPFHSPIPPFSPCTRTNHHDDHRPGSCVLAITMINSYHADLLPERGTGPFLDNDVTKLGKVWWAMHSIIFACKGPGWAAVGECIPPLSSSSSPILSLAGWKCWGSLEEKKEGFCEQMK